MNVENIGQAVPPVDPLRELRARYGPELHEARENLSELNERVTGFIRKNPGTCLLGALALGFLIGKVASR
jgi:hypothetical protein